MSTYEEVRDYYDANWAKIVFEKARSPHGGSVTYDKFVTDLTYEPARKYVLPTKSPEAVEFERLAQITAVPRSTYLEAAANGRAEAKDLYQRYWNNPEGMAIGRRITPKLPDKDSELGLRHAKIVGALYKYLQPYNPVIEAWMLPQVSVPQIPISIDDMHKYASLMNVSFRERWYLGSVILHLQNWWYGLKIRRFEIFNQSKIGDMYLIVGNRPETLPLAPKGRVLVTTPMDFNLIHESVHAVQFSFVNFWEIPREWVEIPAMFVEKIAREDKACPIEGKQLARQAALAIADLTTESPDDFNAEYEKLMGISNVGHLRSRMPQLANYPQAYYGYVLGLVTDRRNAKHIPEAVRDPSKIMEMVGMV